ncbi:MAG: response regulator transcription factor [Eubacteriales bacterium]|jgi:DNA-binding response OmpR family regulator|nr:response regulator transcription factor [Eubacteriales bacterium]
MAHILIVDDEANIRRMVRKYAEFYEYQVTEAADGIEAVNLCRTNNYDAVVMDIMMPELDGFSAAAEILKNKFIPMLMLSARGEEYDKIHGFELGIEDYMVKPFSPRELMLRLNVLITRNQRLQQSDSSCTELIEKQALSTGAGLLIDFAAHRVIVDGQPAELTPRACELLLYMARNRNIALTRDQLITEIWGYDFDGDDRTLDTHVKMIRNNLGTYRDCVCTLRGLGYRFDGGSEVEYRGV